MTHNQTEKMRSYIAQQIAKAFAYQKAGKPEDMEVHARSAIAAIYSQFGL